MTNVEVVRYALNHICGMTDAEFARSEGAWYEKTFQKGTMFNDYKNVCVELGFILQGTFRSYIIDSKTGDEKNIWLYSKNGFVVTFKSFLNQIPCEYYTSAITDAQVVCINITDLQKLYTASHRWEKFGRLMAETAFNVAMNRVEGFLIQSPEERYTEMLKAHPDVFDNVPLYHIASYLGIQGPSLSRIRKRMANK